MPTDPKLLPCPFCGSAASLEGHPPHRHRFAKFMPDHPGSWTIECLKCGTGHVRWARDDVIAAWNTRTETPDD